MTQEKLDNQRDVVKNERRQRGRQPALRRPGTRSSRQLVYPESHPYHHSTIGSMADLDAASLDDVSRLLRHLLRPQQRGPHHRRRLRPARRARAGREVLRADSSPTRRSRPGRRRRSTRSSAPRCARSSPTGPAAPRLRRLPDAHLRDRWLRRARGRGDVLGTGRASRLYRTLVRERAAGAGRDGLRLPLGRRRDHVHACGPPLGPGSSIEALEARALRRDRSARPRGPERRRARARVRNLHAANVEVEPRAHRRAGGSAQPSTPASSTSRSGSTARSRRYLAVDAARVREAMGASIRPDNRVVLTYLPAEAPEVDAHDRHASTRCDRPAPACRAPYRFPPFTSKPAGERPDRVARARRRRSSLVNVHLLLDAGAAAEYEAQAAWRP